MEEVGEEGSVSASKRVCKKSPMWDGREVSVLSVVRMVTEVVSRVMINLEASTVREIIGEAGDRTTGSKSGGGDARGIARGKGTIGRDGGVLMGVMGATGWTDLRTDGAGTGGSA